jgi:hypothetical protein
MSGYNINNIPYDDINGQYNSRKCTESLLYVGPEYIAKCRRVKICRNDCEATVNPYFVGIVIPHDEENPVYKMDDNFR